MPRIFPVLLTNSFLLVVENFYTDHPKIGEAVTGKGHVGL
jgi:hypothetical protein